MTQRPRLLDLFSGAGGAAMGYHRAGFEVVGVDITNQPNYPFEFIRADALAFMKRRVWDSENDWRRSIRLPYDVIHASPPCQAYSTLASLTTKDYPALIEPVRELLQATGLPYVIENVPGAPLVAPIRLCGSSFGLRVWRHRLFEIWPDPPTMLPPCSHSMHPKPLDVTGTGGPSSKPRTSPGGLSRKPTNLAAAREAMGIDWMTRAELAESVPPAFTEWIGGYLMAHLEATAREAA